AGHSDQSRLATICAPFLQYRVGPAVPQMRQYAMRIGVILVTLSCLAPVLSARQPVHAKHGMVVAREMRATNAGEAVLESGGNAIDAAVAVAFTLAVTHPSAGNLGGGGFMLIRLANGRSTFIDFRETAPGKASHDMYLDSKGAPTKDSIIGWRASGVPGTVRGLELAHKKFGRKPGA